jgi:hypothetical protein
VWGVFLKGVDEDVYRIQDVYILSTELNLWTRRIYKQDEPGIRYPQQCSARGQTSEFQRRKAC